MPGMFDKLLETASEGDREILKKYPQLQDWDSKLAAWEDWKASQWDEDSKMPKGFSEQLRAKDTEIEALRMMQGTDMTFQEMQGDLEKFMKDRGVATAKDVKAAIESEISPKLQVKFGDRHIPVTEYVQNVERGTEAMYLATVDLPTEHFVEFGKPMKMADLWKFANENKIPNLQDAYQKMVAPLREQRNTEAQTRREEELKRTVREETLKEVTMRQGALPIDDRGSAPELSPLTRKLNERKKVEVEGTPKLTPGELGSQASAQDAYSQYLKDQAAGTKPQLPSWMQ